MENKARKMFAAVVVIMLCAVAIVGVGYAYTATTSNTNNSTTASYLVFDQTNYTFGKADIQYSTVTAKVDSVETVTYSLATPYITPTYASGTTAVAAIQIGATDTIKATGTGSESGVSHPITITGNTFTNVSSDQFLLLKIRHGTDDQIAWAYSTNGTDWTANTYTGSGWTAGITLADNVEYVTTLYVCLSTLESTSAPPSAIGAGNVLFNYEKGITLNADTGTISSAPGTLVLTPTLHGISGTVTWDTEDAGKATVSGNNSSATVTAAGNGTVKIFASVTDNGYTYMVSCTVTISGYPYV